MYQDREGLFGTNTSLYEYPAQRYPYARQNRKGKVLNNGNPNDQVPKGYARTVTDRNKQMRGLIYHTDSDEFNFQRADEVSKPLPHMANARLVTQYERQASSKPKQPEGQVKQRNIGTTRIVF